MHHSDIVNQDDFRRLVATRFERVLQTFALRLAVHRLAHCKASFQKGTSDLYCNVAIRARDDNFAGRNS